MSPASAAHGHNGANLRRNMSVALPGEGAIIDARSSCELAEEAGAPKAGTNADLMGRRPDIGAGAIDNAGAAEAGLETAEERLLLWRCHHAGVLMVLVMSVRACLSG